jgi:hypothetical protein
VKRTKYRLLKFLIEAKEQENASSVWRAGEGNALLSYYIRPASSLHGHRASGWESIFRCSHPDPTSDKIPT